MLNTLLNYSARLGRRVSFPSMVTRSVSSTTPPILPKQIFIYRLSATTQAGEVFDLMRAFGHVRAVTMQYNPETGDFRKSCVVHFAQHDHAKAALDAHTEQGTMLNGVHLGVKWQDMLGSRLNRKDWTGYGHQLFVKNLYYTSSELHVKEAFSAFGEVVYLKLLRTEEGLSRGMAQVRYARKEDAEGAIAGLNGCNFDGRTLRVHLDRNFVSKGDVIPEQVPADNAGQLGNSAVESVPEEAPANSVSKGDVIPEQVPADNADQLDNSAVESVRKEALASEAAQ